MDNVIKEAKRLYDLGLGIHWLHPKSKRPIGNGWTSGPRKTWQQLKESYVAGNNVGVRLGEPSKIGAGFLSVVDVDVKSSEEHHMLEAYKAAKEALKGAKCPIVDSGRGNGSRHYYCVTASPFKTWDFATSEETVKVLMPSKKPNKKELEEFSAKEIAEGWRRSPAWQVSFYSSGRQVVLPPSIHPDSGREYTWWRELVSAKDLPLLDFGVHPDLRGAGDNGEKKTNAPARSHAAVTKDEWQFEVLPVDFGWLDISDRVRGAIVSGEGVDDASTWLLICAKALYSAGLKTNEVLSVLTDEQYSLGCVAYGHAQTKDRARAAHWIYKYTLRKVIADRDGKRVFSPASEYVREASPPKEELALQAAELKEGEVHPRETGYYFVGPKDGLKPAYGALLEDWAEERPFKTIADMKTVFTFNGTHYQECTPIEIKAFAEEKFLPKPEEKIRAEFVSKVLANNVRKRSFFMDSTEGKVNFQNGVLDLNESSTELLEHSEEYGFRGVLPYKFNPDARCPIFKKWLNEVMMGDQELVKMLQEFMGYVVRGGDYKYHKALWLEGVGRNGKSTFIDVLKGLIGAGNFSVLSIKTLTGDKFSGADLDGKIANFSEETSTHELADSGPFKNLTGDGDIFAQKKYGDPFSFRNRAKLIMTYNTIPDLRDLSAGMMSRPMIVPFEKLIADGEQDRNIKSKLLKELSGIFNFALEGWHRLEEQEGFTYSEKSAAALVRVREGSDAVHQWVSNYIQFKIEDRLSPATRKWRSHEIYERYKNQEKYPLSMRNFFVRLKAYPKMQERHFQDKNGSYYFGINIV